MSTADTWPFVPLGELCVNGGQYGTSEKSSTYPTGLPVLRMGNIVDGEIDWSDLKYLAASSREALKCSLQKGDLLFNRTNSIALVGKSAVFNGEREAVFASYLVRFRMKADRADPYFVCAYINSEFGRAFINANMVRAIGQANVSASTMQRMEIPAPSLQEQRRIAARLREQLSTLTEARAALEAQLVAVESLPAAHLRAVFESEEMHQWPWRRLGDLLVLRQDIVHPRNKPIGAARFVGLEHIESNTGRRVGELQIRMEDLTGRKARFFPGDIVYGYLRPYLNKVWIAEFDGLCSVDQYVFEARRKVADTNFIAWFMRSSTYLCRAPVKETPGWLPRIRTDEVAAVEVNLPPVEVQRSISDKLNAEFAETRELQQRIAAKLTELEKLPAALLRAAFSPAGEV